MPVARILCVDDEAHILQVVSLKLRNAGYEVMTAADGEEGFEMASAQRPDLVITDFQMPYMSGLELCQALSAQESTREIPVIILTARGYALDDKDLAVGNIRDVVSKPFSPRAVLELVERALANAQRETTTDNPTGDRSPAQREAGPNDGSSMTEISEAA